jgi:hypothetical protein
MKKHFLLALLVGTGLTLTANAAPLSFSNGNIFVGFQATAGTGSTTNLIVNIGNAADLSNLNINISSALSQTYGSTWYDRQDLFYGSFGALNVAVGANPVNTLYVSMLEGNDPYVSDTGSAQAAPKNLFTSLAGAYTTALNNGNVIGNAVWMLGTDNNSWQSFNPSTAAFANYNDITGNPVNTLQIVQLVPSLNEDPGTIVSGLAVTSAGVVVPEPSTYALLVAGGMLLFFVYRRKLS